MMDTINENNNEFFTARSKKAFEKANQINEHHIKATRELKEFEAAHAREIALKNESIEEFTKEFSQALSPIIQCLSNAIRIRNTIIRKRFSIPSFPHYSSDEVNRYLASLKYHNFYPMSVDQIRSVRTISNEVIRVDVMIKKELKNYYFPVSWLTASDRTIAHETRREINEWKAQKKIDSHKAKENAVAKELKALETRIAKLEKAKAELATKNLKHMEKIIAKKSITKEMA